MSRTLLFRDLTGGVARAQTGRRAHAGNGPRVVHGSRGRTRCAWLGRGCEESRRGEGEVTGSERGAGDLAPSKAGRNRGRVK